MSSQQKRFRWTRRCWHRLKEIVQHTSNQPGKFEEKPNQVPPGSVLSLTHSEHPFHLSHVPKSFRQAGTPVRPPLGRLGTIPDVLPCRLVLEIDHIDNIDQGKPDRREHRKIFEIRWQQFSEVEKCKQIVKDYIEKTYSGEKSFYSICESYSIIEQIPSNDVRQIPVDRSSMPLIASILSSGEIPTSNSTHSADRHGYIERKRFTEDISASAAWQENLPIHVAEHLIKDLRAIYLLEITLRYSCFDRHLGRCSKKNCRADIKNTMSRNRVETYDQNVWFFPRQFLNNLFEKDLIRHLVLQDSELKQNDQWRSESRRCGQKALDDFVDAVYDNGVRIFATCLNAELSLVHVYELIKQGKEDIHIPIQRRHLPKEWGDKRDDFVNNQCRFRAWESWHLNKAPDSVIMPFTSKEEKGRGGYSKVYKVWIHDQHHTFTPDRRQPFALKEFFLGSNDGVDFEREKDVNQQLVERPHEHLTPFLSAWQHNGRFYMLFPLADSDLHGYLEKTASPTSKTMKLEWLLQQMLGLAEGLRHLHNLLPRDTKESEERGHRARTGIHHDLKPHNVLVFGEDATLKISDFGLARIRERMSRDPNDPRSPQSTQPLGDCVYAAPETDASGNRPSRSTDIWSLGCIYLDMLLWFFGYKYNIKVFRQQRYDDHVEGNQTHIATFWYIKSGEKVAVLKDVVIESLKWLTDEAAPKLVFQDLVRLIKEDMLIPDDPKKRIKAVEVGSELKGLLERARLDMRNDNTFFDDPTKGQGKYPLNMQSSMGDQTTVNGDREEVQAHRDDDDLHSNFLAPQPTSASRRSSRTRRRATQEDIGESGAMFIDEPISTEQGTIHLKVNDFSDPPTRRIY